MGAPRERRGAAVAADAAAADAAAGPAAHRRRSATDWARRRAKRKADRDLWNAKEGVTEHINLVKWSADEDEHLEEVIAEHGNKSWSLISACIPGRSPRQCWDRWRYQ